MSNINLHNIDNLAIFLGKCNFIRTFPVNCPIGNGWTDGGINGCFYMNKDTLSMTWEDARTYCKNLGSGISLAEIHNEHTQVEINNAAKALGVGSMTNSGWFLKIISDLPTLEVLV